MQTRNMPIISRWLPRKPSDSDGANEWEQAVARLAITSVSLLLVLGNHVLHHDPETFSPAAVLLTCYLIYASLLFASFATFHSGTHWRRAVTLVSDIGITSYVIHITWPFGAVFFAIILWVVVGFGVRFGKWYLLGASAYALLCLSMVQWWADPMAATKYVVIGQIVAVIAVPIYIAVLLKRVDDARRHAEASNIAKGRFLANMSHEIRTPLTGIIGMSSVLAEEGMTASQRQKIDAIHVSANRLLSLLSDTLDFARIEAGGMPVNHTDIDIHQIVEELRSMFAPQAASKNILFSVRIDPKAPFWMVGDSLRIRQVLVNLLSNAMKFTQRGAVTLAYSLVESRRDSALVRFSVSDTGEGIPPEFSDRLFERFSQADESITRRHGGSGLGLAISKQLVNLMGGEIGVTSAFGKGSEFWFTLELPRQQRDCTIGLAEAFHGLRLLMITPRREVFLRFCHCDWPSDIEVDFAETVGRAVKLRSAAIRDGAPYALIVLDRDTSPLTSEKAELIFSPRGMRHESTPILLLNADGPSAPGVAFTGLVLARGYTESMLFTSIHALLARWSKRVERPAEARSAVREACRILAAEDDPVVQKVLRAILERAGHQLELTQDGEEALTALLDGGYDLAVLDVHMPGLSGLDVVRALRYAESGTGRSLPCIIVSADVADEAKREALSAGADVVLAKPIEPGVLLNEIDKLVGEQIHPRGADEVGSGGTAETDELLPVLDEAMLQSLEKTGGEEFLNMLFAMFRESALQGLGKLQSQLRDGDFSGMHETAHGLKGSAISIGAQRVARRLDRFYKSDGTRLRQNGAAMIRALEQELASLDADVERRQLLSRQAGNVVSFNPRGREGRQG